MTDDGLRECPYNEPIEHSAIGACGAAERAVGAFCEWRGLNNIVV